MITIDGIQYEEQIIEIGDILDDDLVMCSDGSWQEQYPLEKQESIDLFRIWFTDGIDSQYVDCDGSHEWTLFNKTNPITLTTNQLLEKLDLVKNLNVGNPDGLKINKIESLPNIDEDGNPIFVRCIQLKKSEDSLFGVLTSNSQNKEPWEILTHNCGFRAAAGRLGMVASRMLFDNQKATTIASNPGSALIRATSIYFPTQVYFEKNESWLSNWFIKRGLSKYGFDIKAGELDKNMDPEDIDLGEEEELELETSITEIEFDGIEATIDNTVSQKFKEV